MRLIEEIIDLCGSTGGSLTDALLKTKILLHKIGHQELISWVNDELSGYENTKPVPEYRQTPVTLYATVSNVAYRHNAAHLPTSHIPEKSRRRFEVDDLRQSVQVLERYVAADGTLAKPVSPEWHGLLAKGALDRTYSIEKAWTQLESSQVVQVLTEVRSRLLDFCLGLQDKLGDTPEDQMKEVAKGIDAPGMFVSSIHGDNHTFILGNGNVTTITNAVTKGDLQGLLEGFRKAGVSDDDLVELEDAVKADDFEAVETTKQLGPQVKAWMSRMSTKAVEGAWSIGIGAGGKLLADLVHTYYNLL